MANYRFTLSAALLVSISALGLPAAVQAQECTDVPGEDHPILGRFPGACLVGYAAAEFDGIALPTGAWSSEGFRSTLDLEGRLTRLVYLIPQAERTPLQLFRNYEQALANGGFEVLFSCQERSCDVSGQDTQSRFARDYYQTRALGRMGDHANTAFAYGVDGLRYVAARSRDGGTHVGVMVASTDHLFFDRQRRVAVYLEVMETEAMEQLLLDAVAMGRGLEERGSVTLENIYFDFGAATLTPESDPALEEMAKLLQGNSQLQVFIVGHTDAVGSYEANLDLSRRRAEAVVEALVNRFGVASRQVVPAGVGPLAPLVSNSTEEGRTLNRRVELVAR
jgi:OmpA-OmpF porin, OOP family